MASGRQGARGRSPQAPNAHGAPAALLSAQLVAAVDLELVQSQRGHVGRGEAVDVARRPADAAAAVQDLGALVHAELAREVVLVAEDRLAEVLLQKRRGGWCGVAY